MTRKLSKIIGSLIIAIFLMNTLLPSPCLWAEELYLPKPAERLSPSPLFNPPILRGIKFKVDNPFSFDFILDTADAYKQDKAQLNKESLRLIKYFLASLTIPQEDLWVNLSPYEKNRIIPDSFGLTLMGRDLLAQDYLLKQMTASLMYPEDNLGRQFWSRIYQAAYKRFGTSDIPVNTCHKVWIVPDKAEVYENLKTHSAYIVKSTLKVMLDTDYLAIYKRQEQGSSLGDHDSTAIIKEIIIPQLTREVNQGKHFAQLRQVYNSLILATWYKNKIKTSILASFYQDKRKIVGIGYQEGVLAHERDDVKNIYTRYCQAFKRGVYNFIKEEKDPYTQNTIPRKYFAGGVMFSAAMVVNSNKNIDEEDEERKRFFHLLGIRLILNPIANFNGAVGNVREPFTLIRIKDLIKRGLVGATPLRRRIGRYWVQFKNSFEENYLQSNLGTMSVDLDKLSLGRVSGSAIPTTGLYARALPSAQGHHVWVPYNEVDVRLLEKGRLLQDSIPDAYAIETALRIVGISPHPNYKLLYEGSDSAILDHRLHFDGFYYGDADTHESIADLPVEEARTESFGINDQDNVEIKRLADFPLQGLVFTNKAKNNTVKFAKIIYSYLQVLNQPYTILFTSKHVIVLPLNEATGKSMRYGLLAALGEPEIENENEIAQMTEEAVAGRIHELAPLRSSFEASLRRFSTQFSETQKNIAGNGTSKEVYERRKTENVANTAMANESNFINSLTQKISNLAMRSDGSKAMALSAIDKNPLLSHLQNGGIDLSATAQQVRVKVEGFNEWQDAAFNISPAMRAQLENAQGFKPVIEKMYPLGNVRVFLDS